MANYGSTPIATPTLIFGRDIADFDEGQLIAGIKASQAAIKANEEIGVASAYLTKSTNDHKAVIDKLVAKLDGLVAAPTPAA